MISEIDRHYPVLDRDRRSAELVRELISYLIGAVVSEADGDWTPRNRNRSTTSAVTGTQLVAFSPEVAEAEAGIKAFLKQQCIGTSGSCA